MKPPPPDFCSVDWVGWPCWLDSLLPMAFLMKSMMEVGRSGL